MLKKQIPFQAGTPLPPVKKTKVKRNTKNDSSMNTGTIFLRRK